MNTVPRDMSPAAIARVLAETSGAPPVPPRADRAAWARLGQQAIAAEVMAKAEAWAAQPITHLPLSLYLDYHRTGIRSGYEKPLDARRDRLVQLALAECVEGKGRFLDPIQDALDATLAEFAWIIPAHGGEFQDGLPPPGLQLIDLWSAMACLLVAEVDHLIGDALHPMLRARIRRAVDERGTTPFLARDDMRWMGAKETGRSSPNWAPVCAGLTAGAAIYLEPDQGRLAEVLSKALRINEYYLSTFPPDGGCAEGVGYWEKGVFAYAAFAELLAARTGGRIDPLKTPAMREIALFPFRMHLGPQKFPMFSDVFRGRKLQGALLRHIAARLDLPQLITVDPVREQDRRLTTRYPAEQIRDFTWWQDIVTDAVPAPADWLPQTEIFVARLHPGNPGALVLAAKAGHNGEPHNHNDVGSFVISLGGATPVAEIGGGVYTRDTFNPALRYTLFNNSSLGHSVPVVNGQFQAPGSQFAAGSVVCEGDRLTMDLARCYPAEAGVKRLIRELALDRAEGAVTLTDTAEFDGSGSFTSVLVTFDDPQIIGPGLVRIGSLEVRHDPALEAGAEDFPPFPLKDGSGSAIIRRVTFTPSDRASRQQITLTLKPITQGRPS